RPTVSGTSPTRVSPGMVSFGTPIFIGRRNASRCAAPLRAVPCATGMEGIWAILRERLDYASFVPRLVPDIERAQLRRRDGSAYTVIKNPHGEDGAGRYLRLEPEDVALLDLMDGTRSVQDIVIESLHRSGAFVLDRLARLTSALASNGFFGEEPPRAYQRLARARMQRDPLTRLASGLKRLIVWDIARWNNAESAVAALYRAGGRLAFTPIGAAVIAAVSLGGVIAWFSEVAAGRHALVTIDGSYVLGIVALIALQVLSISVHEAGHALAIRHFGRRVRRLGVAMYYLFPCVYVDSSDMAMSTRKARIVVSLAAPIGGLLVGGLCALVAASDGGVVGGIAFKAASLFIFQFALNLVPILELDGYYILTDLLDTPMLRQRSMAFARGSVVRKLRKRERWTATEIGLAIYGVLAIVTSLLMIAFALSLWQSRMTIAAKELLASGPIGAAILALLVIVFVGPLVIALALQIAGWLRAGARSSAARTRQAQQAAL